MDRDALLGELTALRRQVSGVTDTLVAGVDGLLIVADTEDRIDPDGVSALAAAHHGLAHTTAAATGQGAFRRTVVHSSGGYLAVYSVTTEASPQAGGFATRTPRKAVSVDRLALMVIVGDEGLDIGRLHHASGPAIERIGSILTAR